MGMKQIPLTQGKVALVDDSDFEELSKYKWHSVMFPGNGKFYASRMPSRIDGKRKPRRIC